LSSARDCDRSVLSGLYYPGIYITGLTFLLDERFDFSFILAGGRSAFLLVEKDPIKYGYLLVYNVSISLESLFIF